jgi:hypothetical protein
LLGYSDIPKHEDIRIINVTGLSNVEIDAISQIVESLKKAKK